MMGTLGHQTANLWQVIIIEMTVVKRKSHLENFSHNTDKFGKLKMVKTKGCCNISIEHS